MIKSTQEKECLWFDWSENNAYDNARDNSWFPGYKGFDLLNTRSHVYPATVPVIEKIPVYDFYRPLVPLTNEYHKFRERVEIDGQSLELEFEIAPRPDDEITGAMWDAINKFEYESWSSLADGVKTGMPEIDKVYDGGPKRGSFTVIGGDSNLGKSALMTQLANGIKKNNEDVYIMDFSLDDSMQDKLSRMIANSMSVVINSVKDPKSYAHLPKMLLRRKQGIMELRSDTDKYKAYDTNSDSPSHTTGYIEDVEQEVRRTSDYFKQKGEQRKICVFIDNLHDMDIKARGFKSDEKWETISQWASDLAKNLDVIVFATAELRKTNVMRRPIVEDLKESKKLNYEAKIIFMLYNEVHYKGEAANLFFMRTGMTTKQPVLEIHVAKNKCSDFKGRLFYEFYPDVARLERPSPEAIKSYTNLTYS